MMSFAVLLLCAVSGHTFGSTLKPVQEIDLEDAIHSFSKKMSNKEESLLLLVRKEMAEEMRKLKDEVLLEVQKVEKRSLSIEEMQNVKAEILEEFNKTETRFVLQSKESVEDIQKLAEQMANIEHDVGRDRERADLLEVRLNETADMTHFCLESQTEMEETTKKNIETVESNLSDRMGNVENSLETLRKDISYISDRQDDNLKLTVQNNTNDINKINKELSRIQSICSPPCENGGQCVKNVCYCSPFFTGDTCQQVVCSPPCENGGECMRNNICKCSLSFYGDRCQAPCGVDFDNDGSNGGGNISSVLVSPWIAAVYRTSGSEYVCGASVIHGQFVLTSGYCVDNYGSVGLSVKLGFSDLKKGTHLQEYRVQSAHMHPQYKVEPYYNSDYDIGVLKLEERIPFGPFVRPVCLPPPEIPQDELLYKPQSSAKIDYISEYISSPQTASPNMLNLTILSKEECRRRMKERDLEKYYPSPDLSFCAQSTSTTCPKLGSPLMQSRLAGGSARTWTQVGIRIGCSDKLFRSPRLDRLRAWVDATIAAS